MIEACSIGITLALDDGVSSGLATIRKELALLDGAMASTTTAMAGMHLLAGGADTGTLRETPAPTVMRPAVASPTKAAAPAVDPPGAPATTSQPAPDRVAGPEWLVQSSRMATTSVQPWAPTASDSVVQAAALPQSMPMAPVTATAAPPGPAPRSACRTTACPPVPADAPSAPGAAPRLAVPLPPDRLAALTRGATGKPPDEVRSPTTRPTTRPTAQPMRQPQRNPSPAEPATAAEASAPTPSRLPAAEFSPPGRSRAAAPAAVPMQLAAGAPPFDAVSATPPAAQQSPQTTPGDLYVDGAVLGRWIARHLERQIIRPPSGTAAVDPRLTPTWPGPATGY